MCCVRIPLNPVRLKYIHIAAGLHMLTDLFSWIMLNPCCSLCLKLSGSLSEVYDLSVRRHV